MADLTPITPDMQPIPPAQGDGTPYISERFRNDLAAEPVKSANWTVAGIIGIVALIIFAVVLGILIQDWNFLKVA